MKKTSLLIFSFLFLLPFVVSATTTTSTNVTINQFDDESVDLKWDRVESGLDNPSNFVNGNKPEFSFVDNIFKFNAGQVKMDAPYRGYYVAKIDLQKDFLLKYKIKLDTLNLDSNAVMVYLSDSDPEGFYYFTKATDNSFYTWISSGRSSWSSLYNNNSAGPGFQLIGARVKGVQRQDYQDPYDSYLGENMYGFKYTPGEEYTITMYRKGEHFGFMINSTSTTSTQKITHHWKAKDIKKTNFKYLVLGIWNSDDNDGYGGPGPIGYISNLKLYTKENLITDGINDSKIIKQIKEQKTTTTTTNNVTTTPNIKFIKDPNSKTVYTVDTNKKIVPILSEKIFRSMANVPENKPINWNIVEKPTIKEFKKYIKEEVKSVSIDNVKTEVKIKFIKDPNSSTVYTVDEGNKISPVLNENNFRIFTNTEKDKPTDWSIVEKPSIKEFESYSK